MNSDKAASLARDTAMKLHWQGRPPHVVFAAGLAAYRMLMADGEPVIDPDPIPDPAPDPVDDRKFLMFHSTNYRGMPNLRNFGFKAKPDIHYEKAFGQGSVMTAVPSDSHLRKMAEESSQVVVLDIENRLKQNEWQMTPSILAMYERTLANFKLFHPDRKSKVCLYGTTTRREYWKALRGEGSSDYRKWQAVNDGRATLVNHVDYLMPSCYALTNDKKDFETFFVAQIKEARRTGQGKPVIPFIWKYYHSAAVVDGIARTNIKPDMWRHILDLCHEHADGLFWWSIQAEKEEKWADLDIWDATLDFIKDVQTGQ